MTSTWPYRERNKAPVRVLRHANATKPQRAFWRSLVRFRAFTGGIGSGKTRGGAVESFRQPEGSIGVVCAPTYRMLADATERTVFSLARRGDIIAHHDKGNDILHLSNGSEIWFRTGENPERLRGPNIGWFWLDEAAQMKQDVWNIMIGRLRLSPGRGWITTTPCGSNWVYDIFIRRALPDYEVIRSSTRENVFLPTDFVRTLEQTYTSSFARQEIEGEFLLDVEGALWSRTTIDNGRVPSAPPLHRVVVGVDPKASLDANSKTGIVVVGADTNEENYVLEDCSLNASPDAWGRAVVNAYYKWNADTVVVEVNQGGDMVTSVLRTIDPNLPIKTVHASRGKWVRAEPVAARYEQGKIHHVGVFTELELQMTSWVPGSDSPDNMDALVWGCTDLDRRVPLLL
jgi:phage terminase large subunit-like protein